MAEKLVLLSSDPTHEKKQRYCADLNAENEEILRREKASLARRISSTMNEISRKEKVTRSLEQESDNETTEFFTSHDAIHRLKQHWFVKVMLNND